MNKFNALTGVAALALLVGATSCSPATDAKATPPAATVAPRVLTLGWTGDGTTWPNSEIGVMPLAGKTITDLAVTYAMNAAALTGVGGEWHYKNTGGSDTQSTALTWATEIPAADTWITISSLADAVPSATDNVSLKFWNNGSGANLISVKQIVLTYGDSTTETLTFVSDGSAPVKSVTGSTTTYVSLASRIWTYMGAFTMTAGFAAAGF